jgi:restriction system protein
MSFREAALRILRGTTTPLSAKELVDKALEVGYIATSGATPEATMGAQLYVDIRNNPHSSFQKVGKGKFLLRQQTESAASAELLIEKQNSLVRNSLKKRLLEMDAYQFEFLVSDLLKKLGYANVRVTKRSGDKGIDVLADLTMDGITHVKTAVQVKRYRDGNNISGAVVAQLRGSAEVDQRGLVITTSEFTKDAIAEAKAVNKMPIALINGDKLISLLLKCEVGVKREMLSVYSVNTEYFDNSEYTPPDQSGANKHRGLWPLPGGILSYVETLFRILKAVKDGENTRGKLIAWMMKAFDSVKSIKTAQAYVYVPQKIGVIKISPESLMLTPEGESLLKSKDLEYLYTLFAKNIFAIEEIVEYIKTSNTPVDEAAVLDFLHENLGVEWTTYAQVTFRLLWLVNIGKITRTEDGFSPA